MKKNVHGVVAIKFHFLMDMRVLEDGNTVIRTALEIKDEKIIMRKQLITVNINVMNAMLALFLNMLKVNHQALIKIF